MLTSRWMLVGISSLLFRSTSVVAAWARFARPSLKQQPCSSRLFSIMSDDKHSLLVHQFPCLSDNYGYLLHDPGTGCTAAIDTPDAEAYKKVLDAKQWTLTHIYNTHHHHDHTGGNAQLKQTYPKVQVYGPSSENIPCRDVGLRGGDTIEFGNFQADVLDVGGHTKGHIAYYFNSQDKVFVGDSLFALGCGRMFEGTPEQFWKSLTTLRALPDQTDVYCAHEYTESNGKFALSVEPSNVELQERYQHVLALRQKHLPTVPSRLGIEKATNPFLRCDICVEIQQHVGVVPGDPDHVAFAKTRRAKDSF